MWIAHIADCQTEQSLRLPSLENIENLLKPDVEDNQNSLDITRDRRVREHDNHWKQDEEGKKNTWTSESSGMGKNCSRFLPEIEVPIISDP